MTKGVDRYAEVRYAQASNVIKNPTADDAAAVHTLYVTDACQTSDGARPRWGDYIEPVVAPARNIAAEALKKYNGGKGSARELGTIIGKGLHNLMGSAFLVNDTSKEIPADNALEGGIAGTLAEMCVKNPDLMKAASKYTGADEIEKALGLKVVYDIARAAGEAKERLKKSLNTQKPLPDMERRACLELILQERLMTIDGRNQLKNRKDLDEKIQKIQSEYNTDSEKANSDEEKIYLNVKMTNNMLKLPGLPDYVQTLGRKGPDFAREWLDSVMPNREAFFQLKDEEILNALSAKIGSKDDPFQNKEYQKQKTAAAPEKTGRERQIKTTEVGDKVKSL